MKNVRASSPFGDVVRDAIHAVVDRAPISQDTKDRIKRCGGCNNRRLALNRAERVVKDFLSPKASNPTTPPP